MVALGVVALLLFTACGGAPTVAETGGAVHGDRLVVVATFSVIADFTAVVAGELAEVEMIVPLGGDPHT